MYFPLRQKCLSPALARNRVEYSPRALAKREKPSRFARGIESPRSLFFDFFGMWVFNFCRGRRSSRVRLRLRIRTTV